MNDMSLSEAISYVQNNGRLFKAVIVIAEEIDKVDKIKQLTDEAGAALTKAQKDRDAVTATVAAAQAELKSAQKKTEAAKEKADKEKKELEADDEEKGKQGKKFAAEIEAIKAEFSAKFAAVEAANKAAAEAAHKAEVEALKLEASKDGKVIPMNDEALLKLSMPEIKDLIGKLPKGQLKLSRGTTVPVNKDGKAITDKHSPEFKAFLMQKQAEGALALGQRIMGQNTLNQN